MPAESDGAPATLAAAAVALAGVLGAFLTWLNTRGQSKVTHEKQLYRRIDKLESSLEEKQGKLDAVTRHLHEAEKLILSLKNDLDDAREEMMGVKREFNAYRVSKGDAPLYAEDGKPIGKP